MTPEEFVRGPLGPEDQELFMWSWGWTCRDRSRFNKVELWLPVGSDEAKEIEERLEMILGVIKRGLRA